MLVKYIIKCSTIDSQNFQYLKHMKIYAGIVKSWFYCSEKQPNYAHKFDSEEYCQKIVDQLNKIKSQIHIYSVVPYLAQSAKAPIRKLQSIIS